jgi:2-dehydropantoate 2-reductase
MWRKLALNCAGAVSALTLKPAGIAVSEGIGDIMRALVHECIAVGRAEGAVLDDALVEEIIAGYRNGPPGAINSLHADRLAGRPIEIDARNGAVVRIGRRHDVATPVNRMIVALLEAACGIGQD